MVETTDEAAIAAVQGGDTEAFRRLVERHSPAVFRLAFRMTGNEQDAEDVVQEAFLRAYRQIHRYESRASFATWIYRIAANYSLDLIRARKPTDSDELALGALRESSPGPDRLFVSAKVQETVDQALETLTQQERTAFVLRHFEGQSIEEISGALGIGSNAAKHSIFRAVQKLRKALTPWTSLAT
jgi:RNA polymerase sigma-70 factor (ECF subfamily)